MRLHSSISRVVVALLCVAAMLSCMAPQRSFMSNIRGGEWCAPVDIVYNNEDTVALRTISVVVRYNCDFKSNAMPVTLRLTAPDGRSAEESCTILLRRPHAVAAVATVESVPYRVHNRMSQSGYYIFTITPDSALRGVEAVGVEIVEE